MKIASAIVSSAALAACVVSVLYRHDRISTVGLIQYLTLAGACLVGFARLRQFAGWITLIFPTVAAYAAVSLMQRDYQLWLGTSWPGRLNALNSILMGQLYWLPILTAGSISYLISILAEERKERSLTKH